MVGASFDEHLCDRRKDDDGILNRHSEFNELRHIQIIDRCGWADKVYDTA